MDETGVSLVAELKEAIDRRHRIAVRAVQTLEEYLVGNWVSPVGQMESAGVLGDLIAYLHGDASIRRRVLRSISETWKSVNEIAQETGLTKQQVRGVVYASDLRRGGSAAQMEWTAQFGEKRFRLKNSGAAKMKS